jgi:pimeloyl-ACP methyl ester carboxylesterase
MSMVRRAPVAVIHGLGQGARDWADVASRLDREVVTVDLPVLRDLSRVPDPAASRVVLEQIRHLERPHLVGHSYGGHIALALASGRWRSIVLVNAVPPRRRWQVVRSMQPACIIAARDDIGELTLEGVTWLDRGGHDLHRVDPAGLAAALVSWFARVEADTGSAAPPDRVE